MPKSFKTMIREMYNIIHDEFDDYKHGNIDSKRFHKAVWILTWLENAVDYGLGDAIRSYSEELDSEVLKYKEECRVDRLWSSKRDSFKWVRTRRNLLDLYVKAKKVYRAQTKSFVEIDKKKEEEAYVTVVVLCELLNYTTRSSSWQEIDKYLLN